VHGPFSYTMVIYNYRATDQCLMFLISWLYCPCAHRQHNLHK